MPSRAVAIRVSATPSRGGGSSAISACAASIRNFGLLVRAGGPRRSQASSLRSRFCRRAFGRGRDPVALGAGQHVRRVAALVAVDVAVVHLPRPRADGVEEPPVVRDDDERAAPGRPPRRQVPGQPGDALDVEVVRRLVEQDDVVLADQQRGQRHPAPLPAGQPLQRRVEAPDAGRVDAAEQPGHHVPDPRVGGPLVRGGRADDRACGRRSRAGRRPTATPRRGAGRARASRARSPAPAAARAPAAAWTCRRRCGRRCRPGRRRRGRARPRPAARARRGRRRPTRR